MARRLRRSRRLASQRHSCNGRGGINAACSCIDSPLAAGWRTQQRHQPHNQQLQWKQQQQQQQLGSQLLQFQRGRPQRQSLAMLHQVPAVLLSCCCSGAAAAASGSSRSGSKDSWSLSESYVGNDFFSKWTFFTELDPTHGAVEYVDQSTAEEKELVKADAHTVEFGAERGFATGSSGTNRGRRSVRIESRTSYNEGLFILTVDHIPIGCGARPSFRMYGADDLHPWPVWGEYSMLEGAHTGSYVSTSLRTVSGCSQASTMAEWNWGISKPANNCDIYARGQLPSQGCSQKGPVNSMGTVFNQNNGGTFAGEWDPLPPRRHFSTWYWPAGSEPEDVKAKAPDPTSWGAPFSRFRLEESTCPARRFRNMRLVFDLTFCGEAANSTYAQSCPEAALHESCSDYVLTVQQPEAYWSVRMLDVYQRGGSSSTPWILWLTLAALLMTIASGAIALAIRCWQNPKDIKEGLGSTWVSTKEHASKLLQSAGGSSRWSQSDQSSMAQVPASPLPSNQSRKSGDGVSLVLGDEVEVVSTPQSCGLVGCHAGATAGLPAGARGVVEEFEDGGSVFIKFDGFRDRTRVQRTELTSLIRTGTRPQFEDVQHPSGPLCCSASRRTPR